jgi:RNA polymerase sigma-70 factor (ECF subfamily)
VYSLTLQVLQQTHLAEEATQDAFMKVWHNPTQWDPRKGRFISWLLTVARYTAIDRLRRENRQPTTHYDPIDDLPIHSKTGIPEEQLFRDGQLLNELMEELPDEQAQVVKMGFLLGMSHGELAERLDLPLGTVKTRVRLGLKKLRTLWLEAHKDLQP